jgi:hypothetical protein
VSFFIDVSSSSPRVKSQLRAVDGAGVGKHGGCLPLVEPVEVKVGVYEDHGIVEKGSADEGMDSDPKEQRGVVGVAA